MREGKFIVHLLCYPLRHFPPFLPPPPSRPYLRMRSEPLPFLPRLVHAPLRADPPAFFRVEKVGLVTLVEGKESAVVPEEGCVRGVHALEGGREERREGGGEGGWVGNATTDKVPSQGALASSTTHITRVDDADKLPHALHGRQDQSTQAPKVAEFVRQSPSCRTFLLKESQEGGWGGDEGQGVRGERTERKRVCGKRTEEYEKDGTEGTSFVPGGQSLSKFKLKLKFSKKERGRAVPPSCQWRGMRACPGGRVTRVFSCHLPFNLALP